MGDAGKKGGKKKQLAGVGEEGGGGRTGVSGGWRGKVREGGGEIVKGSGGEERVGEWRMG